MAHAGSCDPLQLSAGELSPWRGRVWLAAGMAVCAVVVYTLLAAVSIPVLDPDPGTARANSFYERVPPASMTARYLLVDVWQRFDTLWYRHIAERGYDRPASVVFYPLYPAAIQTLKGLGIPTGIGALLAARLAAFFLLWGLMALLALDLPEQVVYRTLALLLFWPMSFILFAGYTESFLMCATVWAIYCARRGRWWPAALCAILACLSRAAGVAVLAPLAWIAWQRRSERPWPLLLMLIGPFLYPLWLLASGLPQPTLVYPVYWKTHVALPWATLNDAFHQLNGDMGAAVILNLAAVVTTFSLAVWKPLRPEYAIYSAVILMFILTANTTPPLRSFMRYALPAFPAPLFLARFVHKPAALFPLLGALFLLSALLMFCFLSWYFLI